MMMRFFSTPNDLKVEAADILFKTLANAYDNLDRYRRDNNYSEISIQSQELLVEKLNKALLNCVDVKSYAALPAQKKKEIHSALAKRLFIAAKAFETKYFESDACWGVEFGKYTEADGISFSNDMQGKYYLAHFPKGLFMNENLLEAILANTIDRFDQKVLHDGSIFNFKNI